MDSNADQSVARGHCGVFVVRDFLRKSDVLMVTRIDRLARSIGDLQDNVREYAPLIAYYRVSTQKQGRSGLGLEAQRKAVASFAEAEGFEIIAEFTEVETGKGSDALDRRPQLRPR